MFEHEHPLNLVDLWLELLQREEEYDEDDEKNNDLLTAKQNFLCLCIRCGEEISWSHRYYYTCCTLCSDYSIHKFCAELPEILEDICAVGHTLDFYQQPDYWNCTICGEFHKDRELCYRCRLCGFYVDAKCATKRLQKNILYHPSHKHPLVCIPKQLLCECDACGKKQTGIFYHCPMCTRSSFINSHCAFLPQRLQIQHTTNDNFSHIHPLTLVYSFPIPEQVEKRYPRCRVCREYFDDTPNLWYYKCEICRYYAHLDCATSRIESFMSILTSPGTGKLIKNYEDDKYPDLLHLPFQNPSYSLLKHLFFKKDGYVVTKTHISHQHPLILEDAHTTSPTSSRIKSIAYHDPMKRIELLCDGCLRPIMSGPVYVCAIDDEHCNFVLHDWCAQLPIEQKGHPHHPQHTLIFHQKVPGKFFGIFFCDLCGFPCNGFAYCCNICNYYIDVTCAFLPKEITHNSHPNHLLLFDGKDAFLCHSCDNFEIDVASALLIPDITWHKCDKHPMILSYFPIENHTSDYFCEICEEEFDPERPFYHCRECMQSIHPACAPSIVLNETYTTPPYGNDIHQFLNVKFGGIYNNNKVHQHPVSFVQGIERDGRCASCDRDFNEQGLQYHMIFKCLSCEFAIHHDCCKRMSG